RCGPVFLFFRFCISADFLFFPYSKIALWSFDAVKPFNRDRSHWSSCSSRMASQEDGSHFSFPLSGMAAVSCDCRSSKSSLLCLSLQTAAFHSFSRIRIGRTGCINDEKEKSCLSHLVHSSVFSSAMDSAAKSPAALF